VFCGPPFKTLCIAHHAVPEVPAQFMTGWKILSQGPNFGSMHLPLTLGTSISMLNEERGGGLEMGIISIGKKVNRILRKERRPWQHLSHRVGHILLVEGV
jgi:hypothetical protein